MFTHEEANSFCDECVLSRNLKFQYQINERPFNCDNSPLISLIVAWESGTSDSNVAWNGGLSTGQGWDSNFCACFVDFGLHFTSLNTFSPFSPSVFILAGEGLNQFFRVNQRTMCCLWVRTWVEIGDQGKAQRIERGQGVSALAFEFWVWGGRLNMDLGRSLGRKKERKKERKKVMPSSRPHFYSMERIGNKKGHVLREFIPQLSTKKFPRDLFHSKGL